MTVFTTDEITGLQAAQEAFMQDSCQIGAHSSTQDALGELIDAFTYGSTTPCGFKMDGGLQRSEFRTADGTVVYADAEMRLPHSAVVKPDDKVKLTARFGVPLAVALVYEVMGEPLVGPSGIVCYLRAVAT